MYKKISVPIQVKEEDLLPCYATEFSSGADARASILQPILIAPGESALIPTGVKLEIPPGFEIQVRPRSGLALKQQITVLNTPGTIDADFRGEICVILINHGKKEFEVLPKMKLAQLVLAPVVKAEFCLVEEFSISQRGEGGFGHTGV